MTRKQATIAVRSGLNDDEQYSCVVPPIHLSSTYNFTDLMNPVRMTTRVVATLRVMLQRALAELEGGAGAVLTNTGMSAIHLVTTVFLKPGDLLVAPHDYYRRAAIVCLIAGKSRGCAGYCLSIKMTNRRQALAEKPKLVLVEVK